ncbi:MAG: SixA phosphatase family protein [Acidimicrobiales bacterium]
MPVLLIRHADAASRLHSGEGGDRERHLSPKGRHQAAGLVTAVQPYAPQRILSSPSARCQETVSPLASALRLSVEVHPALSEGSGPEALALVRSLADDKAALCTHGDVIPDVLVPLADEDQIDLGPAPRQAKGSIWVLEASGGRFVRAMYIAPSG